ncbi:MAG TPA: hypothetical protein VNY76_07510 [Candidatus Acidoferrales bacterium]|jgi:hypothetical protein|nr:hypothetical protein [Candidatus Acidoferrales bacterium]
MRLRLFASAVAVASGGLIAFAPSGVAQAAAPTVTYYSAKDQGVVSPVRATAAHSSSTSGAASTRPRGARSLHTSGALGARAQAAVAAPASSKASLLANFNGVSSLDSQLTNFNAKFEPPDQGLCEGNGFVLEPVNSAYKIYHTNGSAIEGPFNVNDIFNEGGQEFTSDPRCHFDPTTNTWFAEILFLSSDGLHSHQDIAVNTTGDPTNIWTEYRIDTTDPHGVGCPCFGDQPRIGIDQYNVYISTDEFAISSNQFNGGQLYAFSKSDLVAGNMPVHFVHFANLSLGGQLALSIEPALSTGTPNAEYFLNSFDPNGTFDNRIGVWAMTDQQDVATGDVPILSATVINSETYGLPVHAAQKGSTSLLDGGDDRMQQAQYIAGNVWGELTTGITIPGDAAQRDGAAWFQVTPTLTGNHIGTVTIANQGYVAKKGNYLIYPALQADASGRAAMVFTETSATRFPSAAYAVINTGGTQFGAPIVAANGTGPYDPNATRWGDYSWAVLDPVTDKFWLATEYMPPKSSQTTTGQRNWGTRVLEVSVT